MYHGNDLGRPATQGSIHIFRREHLAPGLFDARDFRSVALGHLGDAHPKVPVDADQHGVARFDEIRDRGFHPGAARAADGDGHLIGGLEDEAQQLLHFVHYFDKLRVEVADRRVSQCAQHARRHVAGAGTHQCAGSNVQVAIGGHG